VIAVDTSSFVAYLSGAQGADVDSLDMALADKQACLPPVVLTELLSDPKLPESVAALFRQIPLLPISDGYWDRAGALRASVIALGRRARLADTLVAQSCLDHSVMLITRDTDFRHFARIAGLTVVS
jgi:predicted nucleic acid-binding protein